MDDSSFDLNEAACANYKGHLALWHHGAELRRAPYTLPQGATLVFTLTCTQYASAAVYGTAGANEGVDFSRWPTR